MSLKKALIAMSGGVDSSAAMVMLKEQYEVIGVTLKLHDGELDEGGNKTVEEMFKEADNMMYADKARYYAETGKERRR
jgi:tRNA-specific 2-thiouridylase